MTTTQHTPGPWVVNICNENGPFLDSFYLSTAAQTWDGNEEERIVCRFPTGTGQFSDMGRENLANARLISAAPDLLSALEEIASRALLDVCKHGEVGQPFYILSAAKSAIAKAKGETK